MEVNYNGYIACFILALSLLAWPVVAAEKTAVEGVTAVACSEKTAEKNIHMNSAKFWKVIKNQPETLYFVNTDKCFMPNQKIELVETKNSESLVFWRANRGTVKILKVEKINYAEYKKRESHQATEKELNYFKNKIADFTGRKGPDLDMAPLIAVTVIADHLSDTLKSYGSPRVHPEAKSLKKKEFMESLKNSHVYDIRPATLKKKVPLEYAKALEYVDYMRISSEILSPEEMKKHKIMFSKNPLPANKGEPVNIISGCPAEYSAYNTVTLLVSMGYRNVGWFPGGMAEYGDKAKPCLTPDKSDAAIVVEANQVREFMRDKKKNTIVDVRLEKKFSLPGTLAMSFPEKRNALSMPVFRGRMNAKGLRRHKEGYKNSINIPKNKTIVLIGENEYDWRAYKAAIYLKSKGYKSIYWYRNGMKDWAQKVLFYPNQYKLNHAVKTGELY